LQSSAQEQAEVTFTHPAARGAKVWTAKLKSGETKSVLIVITNAELDQERKRYNADVLAKLVAAIEEYLQVHTDIDGYMLANRMRDWENSKD
jgi:hypothetical protein